MGNENAMLRLLAADGPAPELADDLGLFGQFVGSWDMEGWTTLPDTTTLKFTGEWHFAWVLEGRAIQDVLLYWPAGQSADTRAPGTNIGSSLRAYDKKRDAWWIAWEGPADGEFSTLLGRQVGDRIVIDGQWAIGGSGSDGRTDLRFEWSFSEITDTSFRWEGRSSSDAGVTWRLNNVMLGKRRNPV